MYYSESDVNTIICSNKAGGYGKFDLFSSIPSLKVSAPLKKDTESGHSSVINLTAIDKASGKVLKRTSFRVILMGEREKESVVLRKLEIKSGDKGTFTLSPKNDVDSVMIEPVSKQYAGCSAKIKVNPGQEQNIKLYLKKQSKSRKKSAVCIDTVLKSSVSKNETETSASPYLQTIYYKFNSYAVPTEYIPEIHNIVELMRSNSELNIVVTGYTDAAGSTKSNERLSMKRAQSVAELIKSLDIPESRITVKGLGESKSMSGRSGPRYYYLDRKVELLLQK